MAKMVTRTVVGTNVKVMAIDTTTNKVETPTFTLGKVYEKGDEDKAHRAVKKAYETDTLKIASVVSLTKTETLYGLDENKFMELAVKLDKETRKPIEQ